MATPHDGQWTFRVQLPDAEEVFLMGRFNNWSTTATPMRQVARGLWQVTLAVPQELGQVCFFVWRQGLSFGKLLRGQAVDTLSASPA